jgi:hypothetical protein
MATIITKNSQTASAVPAASSLEVGELAVNTADGKLYTEHTGGVVKEIIPSTVANGGITTAKIADANVTGAKLENSGVTAGTYGSASAIPAITVDAKGRITSASTNSFSSSYVGNRAQLFTSSGTFTIPTGVTALKVTVIGGGGGGHRGYDVGGGGGGTSTKWYTGLTPGNTITVTVGAGGATQNSGNNNGVNGGTTSISSGSQSISGISATGGLSGGNTSSGFGTQGYGLGGRGSSGDLNGGGGGSISTRNGGAPNGGDTTNNYGTSGSQYGFGGIGYYNNCNSTWAGVVAPFGIGVGGACLGQNGTGNQVNYNGIAGGVIFEW